MTNFEKIIIALVSFLIIAVLAFGTILFRQQKAINVLTESAVGISKQLANQSSFQSSVKKNGSSLAEVIKQFPGTIESVSGNQLMVSVKLTDFLKPKDPEKFKNISGPANLKVDDFETIEKKMTVNTNEKTVFEKRPLAELKAGDRISVSADKSPYTVDAVTAEKITYIELPK